MKKTIIIILSFILCVGALLFLKEKMFLEENYYKNQWNIVLPNEMSLEYKYSNQGFFGDGERLAKFKLLSKNKRMFLKEGKNKEIETRFRDIVQESDYERIDFSKDYQWKVYSKYDDLLYLLYFQQSKELYVLQITF